MSLLDTIEKQYITAYKAKEEVTVLVLRMLKTAVKNQQVELGRPLTDDEVLAVITKQAKQRQEAADQFSQAGRQELADRELVELQVLKAYLPEMLGPEELERVVDEAVASTGASSMKDMGGVMKAVMDRYKNQVDGKALSQLVRQKLS